MPVIQCPDCGSEEHTIKERLPENRVRYKCKTCGRSWASERAETVEVEKVDEIDGNVRTVTTKSLNITNIEQLLEYSKIDQTEWSVKKASVKTSEVTISGKNTDTGKPETYTNYHVSATLERNSATVSPALDIAALIEDAKTYAHKYKKIEYDPVAEGTLLQVSLFDHHFGQLSWGDETGSINYDIKIAEELAHKAVDALIQRADWTRIGKILLITGNDFFNVDSILNTTLGGTPQAEDGRWKKTYKRGRELWVGIIEKLMQFAPVHVTNVLGNHGPQREYYLADALECWFHTCENVTIDNSPRDRKYYVFGSTLIGMAHGHKEVKNSLPVIMATEKPLEWANTTYHEWMLGHWHYGSTKIYQALDEHHGVRVNILNSLVPLDDWHAGKGYSALRETTAIEFHPVYGRIGTININAAAIGI